MPQQVVHNSKSYNDTSHQCFLWRIPCRNYIMIKRIIKSVSSSKKLHKTVWSYITIMSKIRGWEKIYSARYNYFIHKQVWRQVSCMILKSPNLDQQANSHKGHTKLCHTLCMQIVNFDISFNCMVRVPNHIGIFNCTCLIISGSVWL